MKKMTVMIALLGMASLRAGPALPGGPEHGNLPPSHLPAAGAYETAAAQAVRDSARSIKLIAQKELAQANVNKEEFDEAEDRFKIEKPWGEHLELFNVPWRHSEQPLVIRSGELNPDTLANLNEDLTVMSRIITKTVERETGREGRDSAMGIVLSALPGSRRPQSLYLEGYGALFLVNVNLPLVRPPADDEDSDDKEANSTWEATKREVYGQKPKSGRLPPGDVEFNSEQLESLKQELLKGLRNAANIREVKPEEFITVVLLGSRSVSSAEARVRHLTSRGNIRRAEVFAYADGERSAGRQSTMTLRVKKADTDAFAKGTIALEEFTKRTSVSAY